MDEQRIASALESLAPPVGGGGWSDVVRRGCRMRRRRRHRIVAVSVASAVIALVGALAAGGQIGLLVGHSKEPHLTLRTVLTRADGSRIGTLELELHGAAIVFGRGVELKHWTPTHPGRVDDESFGVRWFLDLDDAAMSLAGGSLVLRAPSVPSLVLCTKCHASESGRLKVKAGVASALVRDVAHAGYLRGSTRVAVGTIALERTRLRRAVICTPGQTGFVCSRFYTGR